MWDVKGSDNITLEKKRIVSLLRHSFRFAACQASQICSTCRTSQPL